MEISLLGQEKEILGLMSLVDHPNELRIHLNLIELGNRNKGGDKEIDNIAGCLLAFACEVAFERGYYGFVSLQPKSKLIDLYQDRYGFRQYGRLLAVEQESAKLLVNKYLSDGELPAHYWWRMHSRELEFQIRTNLEKKIREANKVTDFLEIRA